jgi:hypothetical protein
MASLTSDPDSLCRLDCVTITYVACNLHAVNALLSEVRIESAFGFINPSCFGKLQPGYDQAGKMPRQPFAHRTHDKLRHFGTVDNRQPGFETGMGLRSDNPAQLWEF